MGTWEAGVFDYADLIENYIGVGDWERHWHDESRVPWLYSPSQGVMITYDDAESLGEKLDYVIAEDLGGVMFWEFSGDTADSALSGQMAARLRP